MSRRSLPPPAYASVRYEIKTHTSNTSDMLPITPNPSLHLLNDIARGTEEYARIGNKITITGITCNCEMYPVNIENVSTPDLWRIIIVYDKSTRQNQPSIAELFDINGGVDIKMPYNHSLLGNRFKFIYDKLMWKGSNTGVGAGTIGDGATPAYRAWTIRKNVHLPVVYSPTGSGSAGIEQGGLYMYVLSSQSLVHGDFKAVCQLRYTDA